MALIKSAQSGNLTRQAVVLDMSDLGRQAQRMLDGARAQAQQIVDEARQKANALIDDADKRGHAEGMQRGMNEGREAGRREGYEHAVKEWAQRFELLNRSVIQAMQEWEKQRADMTHQACEDVIEFAVEVARRVTHRIVQADQTVVRDQVAAALKLVSRPTAIEIVIQPEQRGLIEKELPQLIVTIASCQHAAIREDAGLAPGGCVISTVGGRVDASIETQLQRIAECFELGDVVARRSASCGLTTDSSANGAETRAAHDAERRPTSTGGDTPATDRPES